MNKENAFDQLVNSYKINTKRFSLEEKRKFMVVKDAIKLQSFYSFKPVVIASNIKRNTAFIFMQQYEELPGIEVTVEPRSEEHTSELQSRQYLVCRLLLEKKKHKINYI